MKPKKNSIQKRKTEKTPFEKLYNFLKENEGNSFTPMQLKKTLTLSEGEFYNAKNGLIKRHMICQKPSIKRHSIYWYDKTHEEYYEKQ